MEGVTEAIRAVRAEEMRSIQQPKGGTCLVIAPLLENSLLYGVR
jgi:hypothetical protein